MDCHRDPFSPDVGSFPTFVLAHLLRSFPDFCKVFVKILHLRIVALQHLPNFLVTDILWSFRFLIKGVHPSIYWCNQQKTLWGKMVPWHNAACSVPVCLVEVRFRRPLVHVAMLLRNTAQEIKASDNSAAHSAPAHDVSFHGWHQPRRRPLAKADGRHGDSGSGQPLRTSARVPPCRPREEVWHVQRCHAQRSRPKPTRNLTEPCIWGALSSRVPSALPCT